MGARAAAASSQTRRLERKINFTVLGLWPLSFVVPCGLLNSFSEYVRIKHFFFFFFFKCTEQFRVSSPKSSLSLLIALAQCHW